MNAVPLAVVIPAYRARYLAETLESLARQTNRNFRVYVADDGSPEPLAEIVAPFAARLDLVYRRFPENLGGRSLVGHWARAIGLSTEPWVWLFSDDDVAEPECVAAFHADRQRAPDSQALRRLDLAFIDGDGARLRQELPFPDRLTGADYALRLLQRRDIECVVQNMIFPRAVYEAAGGFTDTPGGFCSDCATWPRLARSEGVRRLMEGRVLFRRHSGAQSVAVLNSPERIREVIAAYGLTVRSLRRAMEAATVPTRKHARQEQRWFFRWFRYAPRPLTAADRAFVYREIEALWPKARGEAHGRFLVNYGVSRLRRIGPVRRLLLIRLHLLQRWRGPA